MNMKKKRVYKNFIITEFLNNFDNIKKKYKTTFSATSKLFTDT